MATSNQRIIDRFDEFMRYKGLNDNAVTKALGIAVGTIGKSRGEGRDLSRRNVEKALNKWLDLNRTWLLTGEGPMLLSGRPARGTERETDNRS